MAHSIRRVIARKGQLPSLTWTAISARLSSTQPMYPNAQYTCKMPDDVDYHYPKLGENINVLIITCQTEYLGKRLFLVVIATKCNELPIVTYYQLSHECEIKILVKHQSVLTVQGFILFIYHDCYFTWPRQ